MSSEYKWLNAQSRLFLSRGYLPEGQTAEERIMRIAQRAEEVYAIPGFANKFLHYMKQGWISLASPVWSNFGNERGLPISCNNSHIGDSVQSILEKVAEIGTMTKHGAGTSAFLGDLRPRGSSISVGGTSFGPVHFAELIEKDVNIISQSNVRRGNCAVYLPVEHPDIMEFLEIREEGHPIQKLSIGVTITRQWIAEMKAGDMEKRKVWWRIIQKRFETGYPYIMFYDNVNDALPAWYKDIGSTVKSSNLCTEILEPSTEEESFVCDLSSLNIVEFENWVNTDLVYTVTIFLDMVMEEYIQKTANIKFMEAPNRFARRHRSLGLGVLGWHSFLQSKMLPFGSKDAYVWNEKIHSHIQSESIRASRWMASEFGEPEVLQGYGMRNSMLNAIAPTKSSSFILGSGQISQSIEPIDSNYYIENLAKTKVTIRNKYLERALEDIGQNNPDTWMAVLLAGGSVQHLDIDPHVKSVFKTAVEIDQRDVILQAAQRQRFIDQSQSLNLMYHPSITSTIVSRDLLLAEATGVKTLYYQHGKNVTQEYARAQAAEATCTACEA
ncbi:ribonucleoside-diphosphate reductase large subunit [Sinorhizobium phage phiM9]|uniref:Putative ribonucleoside-diphosphate reductase subunit alpha n=1 Tax=Sinorhizobium phage phiM9 TaxID=1636182 RepID=A0A0F6R5R0_9CAUD|nr:ribonucleoside-diphosphate reductase large subunit [Sinorhizobium phage phiM9]AKE44660.1 putative ribonucleoside-diphosphate reductase subunit alpha [Sinorhizobium phage phiM9]